MHIFFVPIKGCKLRMDIFLIFTCCLLINNESFKRSVLYTCFKNSSSKELI